MNRDPFAAIADPTRRAIIDLLARERLTINGVAEHFVSVSRQAITKQLRYLQESGLVTIEKSGREKYCTVTLDNLAEVNRWLVQYERFWKAKLDQLGKFLDGANHH